MKNKFMLVALIGVVLLAGMILVSCGSRCPGDGTCSVKANGDYYPSELLCFRFTINFTKLGRIGDCSLAADAAYANGKPYHCQC